jgi:predicted adenylyl cyclase CyaB
MKEAMNRSNQEANRNQEIEIRALLNDEQRGVLEAELSDRGAELEERMYIVDMYLCPVAVQSFQEIEMQKVGSFSLRIRKQTANGQTQVEVNTKIITNEGDHNSWEEHETEASSFDEAVAIFQAIGFKSFFTLEKERVTYQVDDMTVCLEDIVDFGPVIEVEVMANKSKSQQAKQRIRAFLTDIGVTDEQIVAKSVTNMLMRERAQF